MNPNDLAFPVVLLCDGTTSMPVDANDLSACSRLGIRVLPGSKIIDLNGTKCVITGAKKLKTRKPWWRPPLFLTVITAELTLEPVGTLSLDELKKTLVKALKRSGWSGDDETLIPSVNQATSLADLRAVFSPKVCSGPRWWDFSPKSAKSDSAKTSSPEPGD